MSESRIVLYAWWAPPSEVAVRPPCGGPIAVEPVQTQPNRASNATTGRVEPPA